MIAALALTALLAGADTPPTPFNADQMVEVLEANYAGSTDAMCDGIPVVIAGITPTLGEAGAHRYVEAFIIDEFQTSYNYVLTSGARATLIFWIRANCTGGAT